MKNPNYEWRPYRPEDLDAIELQPDEREHILSIRDTFEMMTKFHNSETCFIGTAYYNDILLAIGGWLDLGDGLAEGFIIPSKPSLEHKFLLIRSFQIWLRYLERQPWVKRIQTHSLPIKRIDRWMTMLGFVYEGEVKRYTGTGSEYKLWSKDLGPRRNLQN